MSATTHSNNPHNKRSSRDYTPVAAQEEGSIASDPIRDSEGDIMENGEEIPIPASDLETMDERLSTMKNTLLKIPDDTDDEEPDEEEGAEDEEEEGYLTEMPTAEDRDIDTSVISEIEVFRGQVKSFQAELAERDEAIAALSAEIKRLNLAIQAKASPSTDNFADEIGNLWTALKRVSAEVNEMSTRNQEERQLSERKMKKDLARAAPAPIIADKPDVPSSIVTPGAPVQEAASAPSQKRVRRKAIQYA